MTRPVLMPVSRAASRLSPTAYTCRPHAVWVSAYQKAPYSSRSISDPYVKPCAPMPVSSHISRSEVTG